MVSVLAKWVLFPTVGILLAFCTSCAKAPPQQSSSLATPASVSAPPAAGRQSRDGILPAPNAAVLKRGKELLAQYDVQYNQVVRFPHEGMYYKSSGGYALTSLDEVNSKYPHLYVPEKLGEYQFADLTLVTKRTANIFPGTLPVPKDTIEVLTDDTAPNQFFLCYKNDKDSIRFRIALWPVYLPEVHEAFDDIAAECSTWALQPDAYMEIDDDPSKLSFLLISPQPDEKYAYFVHKLSASDCLESTTVELSEAEALSIYNAIRKGFAQKLTQ